MLFYDIVGDSRGIAVIRVIQITQTVEELVNPSWHAIVPQRVRLVSDLQEESERDFHFLVCKS